MSPLGVTIHLLTPSGHSRGVDVGSILSQGLSVLYSTHVLLESMNLGIVVMVGTMSIHAMVLAARALYGTNLYLELVWLLAPTAIVVLLIVRTIAMQCSDEELCGWSTETMVIGNQ